MGKFFEWDKEDELTFEEDGFLDHGKWYFYYDAENDLYEATMNGIYMHLFKTKEDMLNRENEYDFYEYDHALSVEIDKQVYTNKDGKIRE